MATGIDGEETATDDEFAWLDEENAKSAPEEEANSDHHAAA